MVNDIRVASTVVTRKWQKISKIFCFVIAIKKTLSRGDFITLPEQGILKIYREQIPMASRSVVVMVTTLSLITIQCPKVHWILQQCNAVLNNTDRDL
jgi:hypothetical protein